MTFASIKNFVTESYDATAEFVEKTAAPAVKRASNATFDYLDGVAIPTACKVAEGTLVGIDAGCMNFNKSMVEFLIKYPGIAMTLSPDTIIKMAVANHTDAIMRPGEGKRPQVTINMTGK